MKEAVQRAYAYLQAQKLQPGISQSIDTSDFHVEAIDLLTNRADCEPGVALIVAIYSAVRHLSALPSLVILGDLTIQGNIKPVRSLGGGAKRGHGQRRQTRADPA